MEEREYGDHQDVAGARQLQASTHHHHKDSEDGDVEEVDWNQSKKKENQWKVPVINKNNLSHQEIHDIGEVVKALKIIVSLLQAVPHDRIAISKALRFAKGLVNLCYTLDSRAKSYMNEIFAECYSIMDRNSLEADTLYDHFVQTIAYIYGENHVATSDAHMIVAAARAVAGRTNEAIEFCGKALANRINSLGLMHLSTADSHYNLGLLYRLSGDLHKSRKELRIARSIVQAVSGEDSLEIARVDYSLGQTERLLFSYDVAYLHFYLSYRSRCINLGSRSEAAQLALQTVLSMRNAYSDRLISSIELQDKVNSFSWFSEPGLDKEIAFLIVILSSTNKVIHDSNDENSSDESPRKSGVSGKTSVFRMSFLRKVVKFAIGNYLRLHSNQLRGIQTKLIMIRDFSLSNIDAIAESILMDLLTGPDTEDPAICEYYDSLAERKRQQAELALAQKDDEGVSVSISGIKKSMWEEIKDVDADKESQIKYEDASHVFAQSPTTETKPSLISQEDNIATIKTHTFISHVQDDDKSLPISLADSATSVNQSSVQQASSDREEEITTTKESPTKANLLSVPMAGKPGETFMPRLGTKKLLITKDADGRRISIRPLTAKDVQEYLKIKVFSVGLFPYLLHNPTAIPNHKKDQSRHLVQLKQDKRISVEALKLVLQPPPRKSVEEPQKTEKPASEDSKEKKGTEKKSSRHIPIPPPLPTCWPPQVKDGKNVALEGDTSTSDKPSGGGLMGMLKGIEGGLAGLLKNKSAGGGGVGNIQKKDSGPKLKQLHWDTIATVKGTLWEESDTCDQIGDNLKISVNETFPDLIEMFTPPAKKTQEKKKTDKFDKETKVKQVNLLDGQKSQNINIMLAKFGSQRKVSEIIEAVCTLQVGAFTLPTINSMIEFAPSTFADTGEITSISQAVQQYGVEKLGKAERYLYELSKVPKIESLLKAIQLILSIGDVKDQTIAAVSVLHQASQQVKRSATLRNLFKAILTVGNAMNEGTKKSSATGFKIGSLSKLTQTKANSGETLLEYILCRLIKELPQLPGIKTEFAALEEAKLVSLPTLQGDLNKIEGSLKNLQRFINDLNTNVQETSSSPSGDPLQSITNVRSKEMLDQLVKYENDIKQTLDEISKLFSAAQQSHRDVCSYLGEEPSTDPESVYGPILSFVCTVDAIINKK